MITKSIKIQFHYLLQPQGMSQDIRQLGPDSVQQKTYDLEKLP